MDTCARVYDGPILKPISGPSRPPHLQGFTLVELLAVLAVVGLLVALLTTAVQRVRQAAWGVECQNQLRMVYVCAQEYADGWRGALPEAKECGVWPWNAAWWDRLSVMSAPVGLCPRRPKSYTWPLGYGINVLLNGSKPPCLHQRPGTYYATQYFCGNRRFNQVTHPAQTMIFADGTNFHMHDVGRFDFDRHGDGRTRIAFYDGHTVAWSRAEVLRDPSREVYGR